MERPGQWTTDLRMHRAEERADQPECEVEESSRRKRDKIEKMKIYKIHKKDNHRFPEKE